MPRLINQSNSGMVKLESEFNALLSELKSVKELMINQD